MFLILRSWCRIRHSTPHHSFIVVLSHRLKVGKTSLPTMCATRPQYIVDLMSVDFKRLYDCDDYDRRTLFCHGWLVDICVTRTLIGWYFCDEDLLWSRTDGTDIYCEGQRQVLLEMKIPEIVSFCLYFYCPCLLGNMCCNLYSRCEIQAWYIRILMIITIV